MKTLPNAIRTRRLLLCPPEEGDREAVIALLRHGKTAETYMVPDLSRREDADSLFDRLCLLSRTEGRFLYCIRCGGETVGIIHDLEGGEEVGYAVYPDCWGRGYCTEALTAVAEQMLAAGIPCVRAAAFVGNTASLRFLPTGETECVEYRGAVRRCVCCVLRREDTAACGEGPDMIK